MFLSDGNVLVGQQPLLCIVKDNPGDFYCQNFGASMFSRKKPRKKCLLSLCGLFISRYELIQKGSLGYFGDHSVYQVETKDLDLLLDLCSEEQKKVIAPTIAFIKEFYKQYIHFFAGTVNGGPYVETIPPNAVQSPHKTRILSSELLVVSKN